MTRQRITGWHFDPRDTKQQRSMLRTCRAAQIVRKRFPTGTRVVSEAGWHGEVTRHIPGTNAQGGVLVVRWDGNGHEGRVGAINIRREDGER